MKDDAAPSRPDDPLPCDSGPLRLRTVMTPPSCGAGSLLPHFQEADVVPRMARPGAGLSPRLECPGFPGAPGAGADLPRADHALLLRLQHRALRYFLDNQTPGGLV